MGSTASPLRLLQGGAPGRPTLRISRAPISSVRQRTATVVDLGARRRAGHLGELRALLEGLDALWSSLWRAYPGREREVVELHLRFDGLRDGVIAWAAGDDAAPPAAALLAALDAQLEGAAILGAPSRGAESWRSLCRQLEALEALVASLDLG
jgi:hypothetical protein